MLTARVDGACPPLWPLVPSPPTSPPCASPQTRNTAASPSCDGSTTASHLALCGRTGYTRAELLDADVPPTSLSLGRPENPSASLLEVARMEQRDVFAGPSDRGVLTRVFGSLAHLSHTVQTASDALVCGLRGRSAGTSLADTKSGVADDGNADDSVSAITALRAVEGCGSCALHSSSICIASSLLCHRSNEATAAAVSVKPTSP